MKCVSKAYSRVIVEPHKWHVVWARTVHELDVLTKRVNECKDIQHASEFARWLRTSGLLQMFSDNPQPEPLPVDGAKVEAATTELLYRCAEQWKRGAVGIVEVSELEMLNRKLDLLAESIAQSAPEKLASKTPSLRVLPASQHE